MTKHNGFQKRILESCGGESFLKGSHHWFGPRKKIMHSCFDDTDIFQTKMCEYEVIETNR